MAAKLRACNDNLLLVVDSYKVSHHLQYPGKTTHVFSYFESRDTSGKKTCFFGLQYIIKKWLEGVVVTTEKIAEAKEVFSQHFEQNPVSFNEAGWTRIVEVHGGKLPIRINAVLEGTCVDAGNVLFTVENTDDELPWLTNWFETLLVEVWYPMTVATNSRNWKVTIARFLYHTSDTIDSLVFRLHDFGFRGVSSVESAAIGGLAHLVNFQGTDTIAAVILGRQAYGCPMAGVSIPATEHSTITTWTSDGEEEAFRNLLTQFPKGCVACVSDSYNIYHACRFVWGEKLRSLVENRDGTLVIRPDSGNPPEVVVKCLEILGHCFQPTTNSKGYKVLPAFIRLIQGDGIDGDMIHKILVYMANFGWSADNITFGSGGALLQKVNRDTFKCAYKCSFATVDGKGREVFKQPVTDPGKRSKRGRLALQKTVGEKTDYRTVLEADLYGENQLVTVFENGTLFVNQQLHDIRMRAEVTFEEYSQAPNMFCEIDSWSSPENMAKFREEWKI